MSGFHDGLYEIGRLDRLALQDTPLHRLDARAKVLATFVFLVCVVSFSRYEFGRLLPFVLFPVALGAEGRVPLRWLAGRLIAAAPLALVVGVFNPVLDREIIAFIGPLGLSGGWVSYASIVARFLLTTAAALVLIATTSFNGVCAALTRMGVPDVFSTQLLFLYRYIFVLAEEALTAARARDLRSFGRRGRGIKVYGSLLGHLLLRTYARAQRIHSAMQCRGFDGRIRVLSPRSFGRGDAVFLAGWSLVLVTFRMVDVAGLLGRFLMGVF